MQKVFGIGFHKTGTTTLDAALRILGFNISPVRTDLVKSLVNNDWKPTLDLARKFDAFQDNPWPIIYKEMYAEFPESKFILTVRDSEKWKKSIGNSFGGKSTPMREWIYGKGMGDPLKNEGVFVERYQTHNEEVVAFFSDKAGSFLRLNWEANNGWEELCGFLNLEMPTEEFPHANKGQYEAKANRPFRQFGR